YFDLNCTREDTLFGYFDIADYRAGLDMKGRWEGSFSDWEIIANGGFTGLEYWQFYVPSGSANLIMHRNDSFGLQMEMRGDSCLLASKPFSSVDLSLDFYDGLTTIKNLQLERPGLLIDTGGEIGVVDDRVRISVGQGSIEVFGEEWLVGGAPDIEITGGVLSIEDMQLHSRSGALFIGGELDSRADLIDAGLDFERFSLSTINDAGITDVPFTGTAAGAIFCSGSLRDPDLSLRVTASDAVVDTFTLDRLQLVADYSAGAVNIDTLSLRSPDGDLFLQGETEGVSIPAVREKGVEALRKGTVDFDVECFGLQTYPLFSLMEGSPITGGKYSGAISITDSIAYPVVIIDGRFDSLGVEHLTVPIIDVHAALRPGMMALAGTISMVGGQTGEFRGTVPVEKSDWFYKPDVASPLFMELTLEEGDLSTIPAVTDMVAEAGGKYSLKLVADGSLDQPGLNGRLQLTDARFRFSGTEERFRNVQADISLADTVITISRLEGNEGSKGSFSIGGSITLDGWRPADYDLEARLEKILVASIPDIMAIVTGDLKVGTLEMEGRKVPSVTGRLDVNSSEVYFRLGEYSSTQSRGTMEIPSWVAEIDLEVKGNTWIKTPDANVEMQGNVTIHRDRRGTYLRGTLDLMRGWYMVYNNKFRVTSGRLEFVHAGGFRPVVDIEAETLDPEGNKIFLVLSWHQDDVEPRLSLFHEDPGYSETDIWKMLGGGVVGSGDGAGGWNALNTAQNLAANYIEKMLNSRMEGITIELETSGGTGGAADGFESNETVVAIGKYLSEGLYVKYKQGLSITTARHFEVEYRISRLFQI
ncbi:MAG TPA: translocation/assembly module TamB domain-containing protein, partial [Candidatus Krumholzibacterium sp.]|nr:translocation/assembly module TamB domain-containing protein [Candidatus Krumholzibacterium sp.]